MVSTNLQSKLGMYVKPGSKIIFSDLINSKDTKTLTILTDEFKTAVSTDLIAVLNIIYKNTGRVTTDGRKYFISDSKHKLYDIKISKKDTYIEFYDDLSKKTTSIEYSIGKTTTTNLKDNLISSLTKVNMSNQELLKYLEKFINEYK